LKPLPAPRNRLAYCALVLAVIALGLASRKFPGLFPAALGKYPGDALWTMMVFFGLAVLRPAATITWLTTGALVISYLVEFGQLYQAPWIVAVRAHPLGHLVLGTAFGWMDLVAYTAGAVVAMLIELSITSSRSSS
jgi:4-hydroxybenzoate polyprenyltransferase